MTGEPCHRDEHGIVHSLRNIYQTRCFVRIKWAIATPGAPTTCFLCLERERTKP